MTRRSLSHPSDRPIIGLTLAMETSFEADIDLDEESDHSTHSVHDCDLHNDYDNQKLFNFFESYLNKSDKTDAEEEPDLALNDHFSQFMANRGPKTPMANRSVRRISCFADIENQKGVLRQRSPNRKCDQSMDESMSEVTLPWNLNDMNEKEVMDLMNTLEEEVAHKEANCPQLMATSLRENFDKQMLLFNDAIEELEKTFNGSLQEIGVKSAEERVSFNELIDKELKEINSKSKLLTKLKFDLNVIQEISKK